MIILPCALEIVLHHETSPNYIELKFVGDKLPESRLSEVLIRVDKVNLN